MVKPFFSGLVLAWLVLGWICPAQAQIYSWRDANGTLVLSDRPLGPGARSFPVPRTQAVRVTKPVQSQPADVESLIREHADRLGVRADLVRAVIQVESGFNPRAVSPKGAKGLMQLMPATAAEFGVANAFDPAENIRGGVGYLRRLLDRYGNNEELALAAYNAGPTAVDRYDSRVPPYRETRDYVERVRTVTSLAAASRQIYRSIEIVNGRPVPRYSDTKPRAGTYEVVTLQR